MTPNVGNKILNKLKFLIKSPKKRDKLGINARKSILKNHTLEKVIEKDIEDASIRGDPKLIEEKSKLLEEVSCKIDELFNRLSELH